MVGPLQRVAALLLLFSAVPAFGALYDSMSSLPQGKQYDYIIVGAGIGGGVLGRRLSENNGRNVLVIEAGGNPDGPMSNEIPYLASTNVGGHEDWNFTTTPQAGLGGRAPHYAQGKVLGGSSTLSLLIWNRGSSEDFDRWANVTDDDGWSWEGLLPYFKKVEQPKTSPDGIDLEDKWNASVHGTHGPLGITMAPYTFQSDAMLADLSAEMPDEFPFNLDPASSGSQLGLGWSPSTIDNGARSSSWTHYLRPVVNRTNLDIVINTQVTRVLQTGWQDGLPEFRGVEYAADSSDWRGTINATTEVILSAGAILSPKLLMLSGIGDKATLESLGIDTVIDNSNVGQHMQEHPIVYNHWAVSETANTIDMLRQNATIMQDMMDLWMVSRTGPLTVSAPNHIGWARTPTDVAPFSDLEDPTPGPNTGHAEFVFFDEFLSGVQPPPTTGKYFTIISGLISPASYGNVTLNNSSPFSAPIINPNVFSDPWDVAVIREAVKMAIRMANATALSSSTAGWIDSPYGPLGDVINAGLPDDLLDEYVMGNATLGFHPTSSTRMTKVNGTDGVLDPSLRVIGAAALRVVDAGAMPRIPAANSAGATFALAERGADLIKMQNGDSCC